MELRHLLLWLFFTTIAVTPYYAFANADGIYYKDAIVSAVLVPDEATAYQEDAFISAEVDGKLIEYEGKVTKYQALKPSFPFATYYEEILTPIDLKDLSNEGKSVLVNVHYSCYDIGAEKRVADESLKVKEFVGTIATDNEAIAAKADPVKLEQAISVSKLDAVTKAEMIEKAKPIAIKEILEEKIEKIGE